MKHDLGGYFIINGNEKVIVGQEKITPNKILVFKNNKASINIHMYDVKSESSKGFNSKEC